MKKLWIASLLFGWGSSFGDLPKSDPTPAAQSVESKETLPDESSLEWLWVELARKGSTDAMTALGESYYFGRNPEIAQNLEKAFYWFSELAKKDLPIGLNNLGFMLKNGLACEKNYEKAAQAFQAAIDSSLSKRIPCDMALLSLSALYYSGRGVKKNNVKAFELFEKFATLHPNIGNIFNCLEVVEKYGDLSQFFLQHMSKGALMIDHDAPIPPLTLSDIHTIFACFTRVIDKGEENERRLLQLIADFYKINFTQLGAAYIAKILKEFYIIVERPLPQ